MASQTQLVNVARRIARKYGLDEGVFLRLVKQESGWNPRALSPAGAQGLTQLMPGTASGLGVTNPYDPLQNLEGGAKYLRAQINQFGSVPLALAAYNAGPNAVRKYGGIPPYRETRDYVRTILGASPAGGGGQAAAFSSPPVPAPLPSAGTPAPSTSRLAPAFNYAELGPLINQTNALLGLPAAPAGLFAALAPLARAPIAPLRLAPLGQASPVSPLPVAQKGVAPPVSPLPLARRGVAAPVSPLGLQGRLIGLPYQGTHTLGNWESDNAIDISVAKGTPVYAPTAGVVGSQFGSLGSASSRFAGLRMHLVSPGEEFYLAHLSAFAPGIHPGAAVAKGQLLGYTGVANGVAHLHIAVKNGDPRRVLGYQ